MNVKKALVLGFVSWLIPFSAAFAMFGFHGSNRPLFESVMAVVISFTLICASYLYFSNVRKGFVREGLSIGILWTVMNLLLDSLLFSNGPMAMSLSTYMSDIGVTYLMIPIITVGIGIILSRKR